MSECLYYFAKCTRLQFNEAEWHTDSKSTFMQPLSAEIISLKIAIVYEIS